MRLIGWLGSLLTFCVGPWILASHATAEPPSPPIDVWLDVDTANGIADVDDGLMLIQAFASPELNVRGVSVQFGNAPLDDAVRIAEEIVTKFGPADLPVHPGAASKEQLGEETEAVRAMSAALREAPMHIVAVGPVTNMATVLQRYPELAERIESIIVCAGRRPGQRFEVRENQEKPFRDFNFEHDVAAMQVLIDSGVPLVFAGWEVSNRTYLTRDDLETLRVSGGAGAWIAETSQYWYDKWATNLGTDGFTPFDTLAVGWLTHPELIDSYRGRAVIEVGDDDGAIVMGGREPGDPKPYLNVYPLTEDETDGNGVYLTSADRTFHGVLMERLAGRSVVDGEAP